MYMNMCIVMNMNIYIKPNLQELLKKETSMSGLINQLLEKHYQSSKSEIVFKEAPPVQQHSQEEPTTERYEWRVLKGVQVKVDTETDTFYDPTIKQWVALDVIG